MCVWLLSHQHSHVDHLLSHSQPHRSRSSCHQCLYRSEHNYLFLQHTHQHLHKIIIWFTHKLFQKASTWIYIMDLCVRTYFRKRYRQCEVDSLVLYSCRHNCRLCCSNAPHILQFLQHTRQYLYQIASK